MKKYKYEIELTETQINQLNKILNSNRKTLDKNRAMVILLRNEGHSAKTISIKTNLSERTVKYYIKGYALNKINYINLTKYRTSELDHINVDLEIYIKEIKPKTYVEATHLIKDKWGITRTDSWIRKYLNKLGIDLNQLKNEKE